MTRPRTTVSSSAAVSRAKRLVAVGAPRDDLGEHRVEPAADLGAERRSRHRPGCRRRPASGAPRPDRSPAGTRPRRPRRRGGPRSRDRCGGRRPARTPSGSPAAIRSWSATRSRPVTSSVTGMLDLEPRVHLEERRLAAVVDEELAGAGVHVADGATRGSSAASPSRARRSPSMPGDGLSSRIFWWRRWIEQSRSPRWTPFPWASNRTWISTWRRALDEPLEDQALVAERRARLAPGRGDVVEEGGLVADHAHALAATAGRRLDEDRDSRSAARPWRGRRRPGRCRRSRRGPARRARPPAGGRRPCRPSPGSRLAAARPRSGPAPATRSAKSAFSARNPKPGMDGIGAAGACRRDDRVGVEQVERAGPSVSGAIARIPRRSHVRAMRAGDLAAVRDEQRSGSASLAAFCRARGRVKRVKRDTPTPSNASCRQLAGLDPALDRPRRRPQALRDLARSSVPRPCLSRLSHLAGRPASAIVSPRRIRGPSSGGASRRTRRSPRGPPR